MLICHLKFAPSSVQAFETFVNANPRASEFISLFIDENLKKGLKGVSESGVNFPEVAPAIASVVSNHLLYLPLAFVPSLRKPKKKLIRFSIEQSPSIVSYERKICSSLTIRIISQRDCCKVEASVTMLRWEC